MSDLIRGIDMDTRRKMEVLLAQAKVHQDFLDGKKIEELPRFNTDPWRACEGEPVWDWYNHEYRATPEPKVLYVNEYGRDRGIAHGSKDIALANATQAAKRKAVEYVEKIKD